MDKQQETLAQVENTNEAQENVSAEQTELLKGETVTKIAENQYMVGNRQYALVANHRDGFDAQKLGERYSEVLARYDYIVGDWGYDQLRLKGFFDVDNKKALPEQRIDTLEDYLYEYCNFGCAYFVIQRVGSKKEKAQQRKNKKKHTQHAYIEEKTEVIKTKKKFKKTIKNHQVDMTKSNPSKEIQHSEKKGFVIRKREEQ
ncbi:MAG TPA: YutD family protein [Enterococcus columbae]|nr:YutD family protein [Enterococcus columbae]